MKIQTIHTNALGRVLNETSATGFLITDNQGRTVEVIIEDGKVVLRTSNSRITLFAPMDEPAKLNGMEVTGVIVDDPCTDTVICYGCNEQVYWLSPGVLCKNCTRLTPDELRGS